jgi:hypothetical protein
MLLLSAMCLAAVGEAPAFAVTSSSAVQANVVKPLTLSSLQNLDMGTIMLKPGLWSGATVSLSRAGVLTCDTNYLTCSGATMTARYNVQGTNRMMVNITAPDVKLVNSTDSSQVLTMVVDNPGQVMLTSSGVPGVNFDLGGSIKLNSSAGSGDYTGTFAVTVDYQ